MAGTSRVPCTRRRSRPTPGTISPLTPVHGAPRRLYSPIKLGYKLTKYLTVMTFTRERPGGYWEDQGYPWLGGL